MDTEPVLDASTIVASLAPETQSEWALKEISDYGYFHILDLTYYEVANSLKSKSRKREMTGRQATEIFREAKKFMGLCKVHRFDDIIDDVMERAVGLDVTSYDMSYLWLSRRLDTVFITTDIKLVERVRGTEYFRLLEYPRK